MINTNMKNKLLRSKLALYPPVGGSASRNKCTSCGVCCKLFLINLNNEEYESGLYKTIFGSFGITNHFSEARAYGANFLAQNKDDSCVYLKNNSCLIHHKRPFVCRRFFCTSKSKRFVNMIRLIEKKRSITTSGAE